MPHIIPNPTAFFSLFTLSCPASVGRGFLKNTQGEIHETTTPKPSLRRVGNDALFLYPDFVRGGCRRRVMHRQKKGARHGQQKYESRHRQKCRFRSYAQPRRLARTHAWLDKRKRVYILIILYPQTTRTRVRTRETHGVRSLRMR